MDLYRQRFSTKKKGNNNIVITTPKKEIKERTVSFTPSDISSNAPVYNPNNIDMSIKDLSQKILFLQKDIQQVIEIFPDLINMIIKNQPQFVQQPIEITPVEKCTPIRKRIVINRDSDGRIVSADLEEVSDTEKEV